MSFVANDERALGLIEPCGFVGTTEAADAMAKTAYIDIERYEKIGAGFTTTPVSYTHLRAHETLR